MRLLRVAHPLGIPIYPHGRSLLPGLHLAAAFPDAVPAVEYRLQWEPRRQCLYNTPPSRARSATAAGPAGSRNRPEEQFMRSTPMTLPVHGSVSQGPHGLSLVLSQRLDGHDTFLVGRVDLGGVSIDVRILTLDDVTILRPTENVSRLAVPSNWSGTLHLPHGLRRRKAPPELEQAASRAGRSLDVLDEAETRYALTFLSGPGKVGSEAVTCGFTGPVGGDCVFASGGIRDPRDSMEVPHAHHRRCEDPPRGIFLCFRRSWPVPRGSARAKGARSPVAGAAGTTLVGVLAVETCGGGGRVAFAAIGR